jgi:hypothetical protein
MTARSPIELVGAVLDEVEGLRRTDPLSHLPALMLLELRQCLDDCGFTATAGRAANMLRDPGDLEGRTIAKVFDGGLRRGDMLFTTTDGAFCVLDAENDGESTYITTCSVGRGIDHFLSPSQMVEAGMMTTEEKATVERQEEIDRARSTLKRATDQAKLAQLQLERLTGSPSPAPPTA